MRNPKLNPNADGWSTRSGLPIASRRSGLNEASDSSFLNPSRSNLARAMHKELPVEDLVHTELQQKIGTGSEILINQPWQSSKEIMKGLVGKGTKAFSDFSNNDSDPGVVRMKKYGMLGASGLFALFAAQSSMGLVKNLWTGKSSNTMIHIGDAFMKWVMGAGLWATALGKSDKFKNLNPMLWGTGLTVLLSQLKGISGGEQNILAKATKAAGVEKGVKDTLEGFGMVPRFLGL